MFALHKIFVTMLTMGLLVMAATTIAANELSSCSDAYLETSTGNYWLSKTLAKPELEQLRDYIGPDAWSWAEGMGFLAKTLCDTPENHGEITGHYISTNLMKAVGDAADCSTVEPNVVFDLENPLQAAVCNYLLPLFHDDQVFMKALELDPSIAVPILPELPDLSPTPAG